MPLYKVHVAVLQPPVFETFTVEADSHDLAYDEADDYIDERFADADVEILGLEESEDN